MVTAAEHAFVISRPMAVGLALLMVVVPIYVIHRLLARRLPAQPAPGVAYPRPGLSGLVIGSDGRTSTSKLQVVLWTGAMLFALGFMLFWGRSTSCGDADKAGGPRCQDARAARQAWDDFVNRDLQADYFVLLGMPVGVAIAAKGVTTAKVADNPTFKTAAPPPEGGPWRLRRIQEVIGNDNGEVALLDAQFFAFNLLLLTVFFVDLLTRPFDGLPTLPPTLLALAGVSAGGYLGNKALAGNEVDPGDAA